MHVNKGRAYGRQGKALTGLNFAEASLLNVKQKQPNSYKHW